MYVLMYVCLLCVLLGCLFAELLNGQSPWTDQSDADQWYLVQRNLCRFVYILTTVL